MGEKTEQFLVAEAAAYWVETLLYEDSQEARGHFNQWVRRSPLHFREYLYACAIHWELTRLLSASRRE